MTHFLRIEGVNLESFVFDTNDLSTVRGGSLLLLDAIEQVRTEFALPAVTTGASSGIFRVPPEVDAQRLRVRVVAFLAGHPQLEHGTFAVDVVEAEGTESFTETRERLLALNRWRQVRSPSVAVPAVVPGAPAACQMDRVRPAEERTQKGPEPKHVSRAVFVRREYARGDEQKREFYKRVTGRAVSDSFSEDFEDLSSDETRGALHRKMAVVYIDGNRFGAIQTDLCTTAQSQAEFDACIKGYRREVLGALLHEARSRPAFKDPGGRLRLETLLWGGDEILWVVPAWMGWWTLAFFFEKAKYWRFADRPLTHAAGLVFCHHSAPIQRVKTIASGLAALAKAKDRDRSLMAYQVLESFDHTGADLAEFRRRRTPPGADLILPAKAMAGIAATLPAVKKEFPKGKLHEILHAQFEGRPHDEERRKALAKMSPEGCATLDRLIEFLGGPPSAWVHIADLWDYLVEV